ncbi:MAG TPA: flagellar hook-associated protein FlgK [Sedimentisphaerales bacterium]|nr:flagellar hook-associated protein FlgK [Sedimentisphaerales bacterium]
MDSFSIGLSGFEAAQKALDTIGNNIANAATEGYHRQRINLTPAYSSQVGSLQVGGGVDVAGVTRMVDRFLEQELLRQQSSLGQVSQEFSKLRTVESAFGELSASGGLSTVIDDFFNALQDLSAHPAEIIYQNQAVTKAETLAYRFRALGEFLTTLETNIRLEAENTVEQINLLIDRIAELNGDIGKIEITGGQANNLCDQRDQSITELSELINIETQNREYGVVDVSAAGIPVVTSTSASGFEVGLNEDGELGISIAGMTDYNIIVEGGELGGLLSLRNTLVSDVHDDLNDLASGIIQQINQYHVQGAGSEGSFSQLTGWANTSGDLSDFSTVSAGYVYIRVINTSSEAVVRTAIPVSQGASSDTLTEIASYITSNVANVTASVNSSNQLSMTAVTGYKFDFLPYVLSAPTASTLTGASPPTISVSGIYTGTANDTFRFTVSGAGSVGNGTLTLEVKDDSGAGDVIATLNIGSGYDASPLDIGNGIKISLSTGGDFGAGDNFDVDAFADTDTSELLSAVGINTFFSGSSASDMAVCSDISATPRRIATSLGADMTDNANALRMAGLKDVALSSLNSMTPGEFYRRLVSNTGQEISIRQIREDNIELIIQNFANQKSEISDVDINEEAAQMLVFEQMYHAMAKYMSVVQSTISNLMDIM